MKPRGDLNGYRAFTPKDAPIFFGRGRETDGLVSRLDNPTVRFLTVVGAAGSGKSSLVAAGLIPRLMAGAIAGSQDWVWVRFTPGEVGDNPFMALALSFKETLQQQGQPPRDWAEKLEKNPATLAEMRDLALAGKPAWAELLLFIDQFEELFTLAAPRYVGSFVDWLQQAAQTERIRVVATLRADFYHRCVEWPALAELLRTGSYPLAAPGPGALPEMITRPAERAGLTFEAGLIDQILTDTGAEPGALALLAFALAELYKAKTVEGRLTWAAYESFNRVQGAIAKQAEDTFNTLEKDSQAALGDIFRELIKLDERGVATRRRAVRCQVSRSPATKRLIDGFTNARLLVTSGKNEPTVEVAHEALLMNWPKLRKWIEENQEDLHLLSLLRRDAAEWYRNSRELEYCWADRRLKQAIQMVGRLQPDLSVVEKLFLTAVQDRLVEELNNSTTHFQKRVEIGGRLAEIGDCRPGVGLRQNGLPDLLWVKIPGTAVVRESSLFSYFTGLRLGSGVKPDYKSEENETWSTDNKLLEITNFELAVYPLTVAQFQPFLDQSGYQEDRYWSRAGRHWRDREPRKTMPAYWNDPTWMLPNHPVVGISWYEAEAYCNWLNEQLQLPLGTIRLPTEAEWEWVARGPDGQCYPWGNEWEAWRCNSDESGISHTSAVGSFPGGAAGWWKAIWQDSEVVHDLAGNIWEWTASLYSETGDYFFANRSSLNIKIDHNRSLSCVLRGGSCSNARRRLRAAARNFMYIGGRKQNCGFRLARTLPRKD